MKIIHPSLSITLAASLVSGIVWAGVETKGALPIAGKSGKPPTKKAPPLSFGGLRVSSPSNSTDAIIKRGEQRAKTLPNDSFVFSDLAWGYLQKARETNDPVYYTQAETALRRAQEIQPNNYSAMRHRAALHSARHEFSQALEWVEKARKIHPGDRLNDGLLVDIYTELGQYEKAKAHAQKMMDLRPDRSSYSRGSYLQELHGNDEEAIEMMRMAIDAGSPWGEGAAWCHTYLGHLYFNTGALASAEREYNAALASFPGYSHAFAGLGKAKAARKEYPAAISLYNKALQSGPHHEVYAASIELYTLTGQKEKAKEQRDRLTDLQKRYRKNGMDIDFEMAKIDAEGGKDLRGALKLAKEEVKTHGNIEAYDALAWIAYRNGDLKLAQSAMEQAMRLGTRSPLMLYHAAKIQERRGYKKESLSLLNQALSQCPYFHVRYADDARSTADRLLKNLTVRRPAMAARPR